jgi:hypothetical protein
MLINNQTKWPRDMAQAVECLLCKWEALNSNPSPTSMDTIKQKYGHYEKLENKYLQSYNSKGNHFKHSFIYECLGIKFLF